MKSTQRRVRLKVFPTIWIYSKRDNRNITAAVLALLTRLWYCFDDELIEANASGNILTTENQIAKRNRIIQTLEIREHIFHKQNCLSYGLPCRVGIRGESPHTFDVPENSTSNVPELN